MTETELLVDALLAGTEDLRRHAALLNEINVFPVMDADTGANMCAALSAVASNADRLRESSLSEISAVLDGPLLACAPGNSGIILAGFLTGFFDHLGKSGAITLQSFTQAVGEGRDRAYQSVGSPREGTILTAMTAFRDILGALDGPLDAAVLRQVERRLGDAVLNTRQQLDVLGAAGVPDAGALGFHLLACGLGLALVGLDAPRRAASLIADRISGETSALSAEIRAGIDTGKLDAARRNAATDRRYCINLLVRVETPVERWEGIPEALGSSVNLTASGAWAKLHVHADDPEAIKARATGLGEVVECRIQDMMEALVARLDGPGPMAPVVIRVAADSAVSLDRDLAASLGIAKLDHHINVSGRTVKDADVDLPELMAQMRLGARFTTAQVSPSEVVVFFDEHLRTSELIVFIAVGRAYTGTQETVLRAAQNHLERARITVLDSRAASGQQGIACVATARFARSANRVEDVVAYAKRQILECREYLFIDDLSYLKRSGRIGSVKAAFASALSIKPIVGHGPNGAITVTKVRSREAAEDDILERVADHPGDGRLLAMVEHTDNAALANDIRRRLIERLPPDAEIFLSPLSSASAIHMGPGTWGVAVTRL